MKPININQNDIDSDLNEIDKQRLNQFNTMTQEQLEIYAMNLKPEDKNIRPLLVTEIDGMPINVFGHPSN